MKRYILTLLTVFTVSGLFAQDFYDALRYSQSEYKGTARSISMGNAFGALGGDFISASINPAGLGFYRSGELSFSAGLDVNQLESSYLGNTEIDNNYNPNINNLSYVATSGTGSDDGIVSISFGIGFNRTNDFHSNAYIQGFEANTTLLNYFADYANQSNNPSAFDGHYEGLAWNTWLIDEDPNLEVIEGIYYNDLTDYNQYEIYDENNNYLGLGYDAIGVYPHQQKKTITRDGRVNEYLVSMGMNINHKVYLGLSLGLHDLSFTENTRYMEIDNEENSAYFNNYELDTRLYENGTGINFKAGFIYRPFKSLRLGAAIHTPTFYNIVRDEEKKIISNFDQELGTDELGYSQVWEDESELYYEYRLETPSRVNLSAAYTIGEKALISLDYELVNYGMAKFRDAGDNFDYTGHNSDINNVFKSTSNIRLGGEYRVTPNVSVRGGYNLMGNPWNNTYTYNDGSSSELLNSKDTYSSYSGGIGYRQNNFYVDFSYRLYQAKYAHKVHEIYYTNPSDGDATATLNETDHQATITLGFRF